MNRIDRYLIWLVSSALAAAAVAGIAFAVQQEGFAPAILFPLAVGGVLGAALATIRRFAGVPAPRAAVIAAVAWGLLVVVGQDYLGHRRRARALEEEMASQGPIGVMAAAHVDQLQPRFIEHLTGLVRREPIWWTFDVLLTAGSAALATGIAARRIEQADSHATARD